MKIRDILKAKLEPKLWELFLVIFLITIGTFLFSLYFKRVDSTYVAISYILALSLIIILRAIRIIHYRKGK